MTATIVIACPQCQRQFKAPAEIQGKRVRCKACGQTFAAQPPPPVPSDPAPRAAKPNAAPAPPAGAPPKARDESKPYGVVDLELTPRCPHCAAELPDDKAFICLNCGYNSLTREKYEVKYAIATTGWERFVWLLPGIACVLGIVPLVGAICYLWLVFHRGEGAADGQDGWLGARVWGSVICGVLIWVLGQIAFRRLVLNPTPPEKFKL